MLILTTDEQVHRDWRMVNALPILPDCTLFMQRIDRSCAYARSQEWGPVPIQVNQEGALLIQEEVQRNAPYRPSETQPTSSLFGHPLEVTDDASPYAEYVMLQL